MKQKNPLRLFLILLMLTAASLTLSVYSAGNTILSVTPAQTNSSVSQSFTVNVTISNVVNLSAWVVKLSFNPHIINCTRAFVPDDNIFAGHSTTGFSNETDYVNGSITAFYGWLEWYGFNGSGKLCSFTFQALFPGFSALSFVDFGKLKGTTLMDPAGQPTITFQSTDGMVVINQAGFNLYVFTVTQNGVPYNITIFSNSSISNFNFNSTNEEIDFNALGTQGTVGSSSVSIPKPLLNGTFAVLTNDTLYCTLSADASNQYLSFNYKHTATPVHIQIITTVFGDINGDRRVNMLDVAIVARAFGASSTNPNWDPRIDLNNDLIVNMVDISIAARNFGNIWTP